MNRLPKSLMVLKGVTNQDIARTERVSETWVSLVLTGKAGSKRIRAAIARAVGEPVKKLWPNDKRKAA